MSPLQARLRALARFAALAALLVPIAPPALAFDTGPHFDLTADVLWSENLSPRAIRTAQCANFMVDFYEFMRREMFRKALDKDCRNDAEPIMAFADAQHFDDLESTAEVAKKWDAMLANTKRHAEAMAAQGDVLGLLALLGASLHNVQDFYSHSNWAEAAPAGPRGTAALAAYGSHPTWLSVDRAVREKLDVYTVKKGADGKDVRSHGDWDSPSVALNKDWTGRPFHTDAYVCAYFATRQWTRLFRTWVGEKAWTAMRAGDPRFDPEFDWTYARKISFYGGHWNGNGGPTGLKDVLSSRAAATAPDLMIGAVLGYIGIGRCVTNNMTPLRRSMQSLLLGWGEMPYRGPVDPALPSAGPDSVAFTRFQVHGIHAIDPDDGIGGGELDWYGRASIGDQQYWTGLIDEHNNFDFDAKPYAPWTLMKAIPTAPRDEPVTSLVVQVRTADEEDAGTDDAVFLRLSNLIRLEFPYHPNEDDFERGTTMSYAFDVPPGLRVRDLATVAIEKPSNDSAWLLGGLKLVVNGRLLYSNDAIHTWLGKDKRSWQASDFKASAPTTQEIPIRFQLMELDYSEDDQADIHPTPGAKGLGFLYSPASGQVRGDVTGPARFVVEGRGDSDRARVNISVDRVTGSCRR